jgi:hypothetical protein
VNEPKPQEEKLFLPDPEPEPMRVKVRAVCGALIGVVFAAAFWLAFDGLDLIPTALLFGLLPAVTAYVTVRSGSFWKLWIRG